MGKYDEVWFSLKPVYFFNLCYLKKKLLPLSESNHGPLIVLCLAQSLCVYRLSQAGLSLLDTVPPISQICVLLLYIKSLDDGHNPKSQSFYMWPVIVKTLQNLNIITFICMHITKTSTYSHVDSAKVDIYGRITSTMSPSFYVTTFSAGLPNFTVFLRQSHDCSCYVSMRILAYASFWLQKHMDRRIHVFAHCTDL